MTTVLRYAVFTEDVAGGNPAGVVLDASGLTDPEMLSIAAHVGYSETAFLVGGPGSTTVRYFSPVAEVSFCGHATVAAAVAHAERHGAGVLHLRTGVGPVDVVTSYDEGRWRATLTTVPPRNRPLPDPVLAELLAVLGWAASDLDPSIPPVVAYAGAWHPVVAAATRARLAALDHDQPSLEHLADREGWTTVDLVWREGPTRFHARNPFPAGRIREDPATGAAAGALGGYLGLAALVDLPSRITVLQGHDMGRPGTLTVDVPTDPSRGVGVTGSAVRLPDA